MIAMIPCTLLAFRREDCKYDEKGRWTCLGPCKRSQEDANILYENKLLGVPRIRMVRINQFGLFNNRTFYKASYQK